MAGEVYSTKSLKRRESALWLQLLLPPKDEFGYRSPPLTEVTGEGVANA
jgi:hypothetical protein